MFKKNILLAAFISFSTSVVAVSPREDVLQEDVTTSLRKNIALGEEIILGLEQKIERISFLEWLVSLEGVVCQPYVILTDTDDHITVFFNKNCKFIFKHTGDEFSSTAVATISACQDSKLRQAIVAMVKKNDHVKPGLIAELAVIHATQAYLKELLDEEYTS